MKKIYCNKLLLFSVVAACLNVVFVGSMGASVFATSSLNVTIANTISLDIMPKSTSGTFAHSSTSANTVTVMTDNYTGYTLGIAASTANDNALSYKENNTIVDSINSHNVSAGVSEANYANDSYASSNNLNNTWGYRPSTYYDTANNTNVDNTSTNLYFPAPTSTSVNTLAKTTTANPSTADNYNIAIGARAGTDKTPGAYTNTLVLTVVANPTPYSLTYNANAGSDTVTNMPTNVTNGSTYAETVQLGNNTPVRDNYDFNGWCTVQTTDGQACNDVSGTSYAPNANWTIDQTSSTNTLTLYAVWSLKSYTVTVNFAGSGVSSVSFTNATYGNANTVSTSGGTTSLKYNVPYTITMTPTSNSYKLDTWATTANGALSSTTDNPATYTVTDTATLTVTGKVGRAYMQDQDASKLAALMPNVGDTTILYDKRDEKPYTVGRLKMSSDGSTSTYWMLENLALDITAVSLDTLKGNTNADDTSLTYLKNGGGSSHYATAGVSKAWTSSSQNYFDKPMIAVDSATSGGCNNEYCVNDGSAGSPWSYDSVTSVSINNVTSVAQGKIGVYYNYCAASAGYYCYASRAGVDNPESPEGTTTLQDSKYDICPKGWRLPTSTSNGEFQALYTAYNSDYTNFQKALSTPLSGDFYSGKARYQGNGGYFWSSTWFNTGYMYRLVVDSSSVNPSKQTNRHYGNSVRCILAE